MIELILVSCIVAAVIAIETKNLLSSIISLGGVGFGLAIIMLFLRAPDVAIVQILVEVILLIILIRATINRDVTAVKCKREFFSMVFGITMVGAVLLAILFGISSLPEFGTSFKELTAAMGQPLPGQLYLINGLEQTNSPNIVTAVLLDYRAYDTLGETSVLFAAIIGAITILRKRKADEEQ
ncbi:MAG: hydrogen gas-evolving membrane-bound hydrogenase subunit E [Elusimicrobiota bacterium]